MSHNEDIRFKHKGFNIRVSLEAWADTDMLNKNKNEAIRIADKKLAAGEIQNNEVLITTKDVIDSRT
jgi:hypothetical protein